MTYRQVHLCVYINKETVKVLIENVFRKLTSKISLLFRDLESVFNVKNNTMTSILDKDIYLKWPQLIKIFLAFIHSPCFKPLNETFVSCCSRCAWSYLCNESQDLLKSYWMIQIIVFEMFFVCVSIRPFKHNLKEWTLVCQPDIYYNEFDFTHADTFLYRLLMGEYCNIFNFEYWNLEQS